ncbi:hypothetical protein CDIK_3499 [Cucumispora dikerogammari]|nr:hypothetical protein CDIK_3499 [Cucumispora dikerogammari]
MVEWIRETQNIVVSKSTVDCAFIEFYYTLKRVTLVSERRNSTSTIAARTKYYVNYKSLKLNIDNKNFVFLDKVGFDVVFRTFRDKSVKGESAYVSISKSKRRNISVVAEMNKHGMLYYSIYKRAVNGKFFKVTLKEINEKCISKGIVLPIFVMDNARIHHYRKLTTAAAIGIYNMRYLPLFFLFFNIIENVFSVWENSVVREGARLSNNCEILFL